jgi:thymidine kinase
MAKLYFYYSTMNAGKSTSLLQSSHNYRERGMRTLVYTARLDQRGGGKVHSRIGLSSEAQHFDQGSDLYAEISSEHAGQAVSCVLLDEAQFLSPSQIEQLAAVVDRLSIPVLCYGLRTDFRGELFPGSARLLALADELSELKTICHCGRKATMVVRVGADGKVEQEGAQVEIGGNERYLSLCRRHFFEATGSRGQPR